MRRISVFLLALFVISFLPGCILKSEKTDPEITLSDPSYSKIAIDCKKQSVQIGFTSNVAWSTSGAAEWLSVSPSSGNSGTASINIDVQENTSKQSRTAFLRISDKSLESTIRISITQEAAPEEEDPIFNIDKNDFRVNADGGDIELKVTHNIDYKITSRPEWVKQTSMNSSGNEDSYTFSVERNSSTESREGVIVFCNDLNVCIPVNIKQTGISVSLSVSPASFFFSYKEENDKFTITSNTGWKISNNADWIELGTNEGTGNSGVSISVSENTTTAIRKATITVSTLDESSSMDIAVQQNGAKEIFSIDQDEFNVAAGGETFSVKVTHNIGYKINSAPDWVKQIGKSSSGNVDTYTFKADANSSTQAREGVIVFCNDNEVCVPVTVKQTGADASLSVSPANLTFIAQGGTKTFSVTSNTTWAASSSESWAKLDKTDGSGNAQVSVTVSENNAITARTATISVKTSDGKSTTAVVINQSAGQTEGGNDDTTTGGKITLE